MAFEQMKLNGKQRDVLGHQSILGATYRLNVNFPGSIGELDLGGLERRMELSGYTHLDSEEDPDKIKESFYDSMVPDTEEPPRFFIEFTDRPREHKITLGLSRTITERLLPEQISNKASVILDSIIEYAENPGNYADN